MYQINDSCVYVKGAKNGAIYDFRSGKVYSINHLACDILDRYISDEKDPCDEKYLSKLHQNNLISENYKPIVFISEPVKDTGLEVAWIEITHICNLRCVHCYEGEYHSSTGSTLTLKEWKGIIDQLEQLRTNRLIIIGGEPCCSPYVSEIISYSSNKSMDITLFTNGTLMNNELINTIIRSKIRVKLSVYGPTPYVHDSVTRISGSYDKMVSTVKKLVNAGVKVSAAVIVMKENENFADETVKFCNSIGMRCSRYDVIREVFGGSQSDHLPLNNEILRKVYFTKPNFIADKIQFMKNIDRNSCWYGKIAIKENGDVIPCEFERDFIYGNAKDESLFNIINNDRVKSMWLWDFSKVNGCADCEFRFACKDCRPLGKGVSGELNTKNPRCLYDSHAGVWKCL